MPKVPVPAVPCPYLSGSRVTNVCFRAGRYFGLLAVALEPGHESQVGRPFLPRTGPAAVAGPAIPVHEGALVRRHPYPLGRLIRGLVRGTAL